MGEVAALLGLVALWLGVRLPWFGHMLSWDEALNLLTCRADFLSEVNQFTFWRLRYPPLHDGMLLLLDPSSAGFAWRAEALSLAFSALAMIFVYVLNRKIYGLRVALWSAAALALMPAAIFFDRWIKQDIPLSAIGYLALACFVTRRYWSAGVLMGFAFLCKHMAGYYGAALALLALPAFPRREFWRAASIMTLCAIVVGGWWYLSRMKSFSWFMSFAVGGMNSGDWVKPMTYYAEQAPVDLGWAGLALAVAGIGAAALLAWKRHLSSDGYGMAQALWPFALLAPALVAIHLSYGKTPWYTIVLYPAAATLVGLGANALSETVARIVAHHKPRLRWAGGIAAAALLGGNALAALWGVSYDEFFARKDRLLMLANRHSKEAGELVRIVRREGERYAATDMAYWQLEPAQLCGVFAFYAGHLPELMISSGLPAEEIVGRCRAAGIGLVFVSISPGALREVFLKDFTRLESGCEVWHTPAGVLIRFGQATSAGVTAGCLPSVVDSSRPCQSARAA